MEFNKKENNNIIDATQTSNGTYEFQGTPATENDFQVSATMEDVNAYKEKLYNLPEVRNLTNEIDITNTNTILTFGQNPCNGLSKTTDELMATTKRVNAQEASAMLTQLTKIMDKFDIKELENPEEAKGLKRWFNNARNRLDELFAKYDDMGKEVDKVYTILKQYEQQIFKSQNDLKKMYEANTAFYEELEKYIVAGEIAKQEIEQEKNRILSSNNLSELDKQNKVQQLDMLNDMVGQRIYDLQIAENVAMQTAPMIQTMVMSNFNLQRKINSSFIITLPIFKQCLIQAITLKRQEIQAKSIKQLDDKTAELLSRNAQNTAKQSVNIAKLASGASIPIETLRNNYQTILNGIAETKQIQESQKQKQEEDSKELEQLKMNMKTSGLLTTTAL